MTLLIAPIDKNGNRKVGIKVTGATGRFIEIFKTFDFELNKEPFAHFFHFCGELRSLLLGTEYVQIELTDGYDVQERNYLIDYTEYPVKVTCEDQFGFAVDDRESGEMSIKYKKDSGIVEYKLEKITEISPKYLKCIVKKDTKSSYRQFLRDKIESYHGFEMS